MAIIGLIGGTGADLSLDWGGETPVSTPFGDVILLRATHGPHEVLFLRRHGEGHRNLSAHVDHRANVMALKLAGCDAIIATTVCGVLDPTIPLAGVIVFDDLFFPDNRLPSGAPCTFFDTPGEPGRGHYIFGSPFSAGLRGALIEAAVESDVDYLDRGTYAYSLGPRFNTRSEVAWMRAAGAIAVSQTAGPEAVLAGELEMAYALLGFGTDYANGVQAHPTPVEQLDANIAASRHAFAAVITGTLNRLDAPGFDTGFVYRFE